MPPDGNRGSQDSQNSLQVPNGVLQPLNLAPTPRGPKVLEALAMCTALSPGE